MKISCRSVIVGVLLVMVGIVPAPPAVATDDVRTAPFLPGTYRQALPLRRAPFVLDLRTDGTYRWGPPETHHEEGLWRILPQDPTVRIELTWQTREPLTEELFAGGVRTVTAMEDSGVMVWWNGAHLVGTFVHASRPGLSPLPFSVTTVDELRVPGMAGALIHRAQRLHDGRNDAAWAVQSTANAAGTTGDAGTANAVGTAEPAGASLTLALRVAPWVRSAEIQAVILIPAAEGTAPPAWVMIDNERFALNPAPQPTTIWISPRVADTLSLTVSSASAPTEPRAAAVGLAEIVLLGTTATRYYLRSSYR